MSANKKILIGVGLLVAWLAMKNYRALTAPPTIIGVRYLPGNYNAITIPPFGIYVLNEHLENSNLINHELVHWQQYKAMGMLKYYATYLKEFFQYGYDAMPMELQARFNESELCRANYSECVRNGTAKTVTNKNFRV